MKKLSYLDTDYFDWYNDIVAAKRENVLLTRPDFLDAVKVRYEEYFENFSQENLLLIKDSIYAKNHPELTSCYKSKTQKVSELITEIKDNQSIEAKSKCQYCGINKPKTIDHYLPISLYPEFAVLAINLLPCCNECNKKKDNYWKADSFRGILNFYVDNIPDEQFLTASISVQNDLPLTTFTHDFSSIEEDLSNIIRAHFNRLELFDRYDEESAEEISEISRQLSIYSKDKTIDELKVLLKEDSEGLKNKYGNNYWKAVLRNALSESNDYLNDYNKYMSFGA